MDNTSSLWEFKEALPSDAKEACALIFAAYEDFTTKIVGSPDAKIALSRLEHCFTHYKIGLVHHSHTELVVHKESGALAGVWCALRGDFVPHHFLSQAEILGLFLERNSSDKEILKSIRECTGPIFVGPDELHMDVISVSPRFQKKGLSRLILERAHILAKSHNLTKLSLLSVEKNHAIYQKLGFLAENEFLDAGHMYTKFVMPVDLSVSDGLES